MKEQGDIITKWEISFWNYSNKIIYEIEIEHLDKVVRIKGYEFKPYTTVITKNKQTETVSIILTSKVI